MVGFNMYELDFEAKDMATSQATVNYILNQLSKLKDVSARKMFGEYALYYNSKVVGLICDDTLFIKITDAGKNYVGDLYLEGEAYPNAKPSIQIEEEQIEDTIWICELIKITAENLPEIKKKKRVHS
jgi:TfoX/Sxy family transcriptional regulator of competence genes